MRLSDTPKHETELTHRPRDVLPWRWQNIGIDRGWPRNSGENTMDRTLERSTMRKVYLRLLPFAVLSYVLAYIDRINVSFAGLTMRGDLSISAGTFGFAV